jgi:hypothetical protein
MDSASNSPNDKDERTSRLHWFLVGGTGFPPTQRNLLRMASERKAVYREDKAYTAARNEALAEFEEKWGPHGVTSMAACLLGTHKRKRPGIKQTMERFGPKGCERDRWSGDASLVAGSASDGAVTAAGEHGGEGNSDRPGVSSASSSHGNDPEGASETAHTIDEHDGNDRGDLRSASASEPHDDGRGDTNSEADNGSGDRVDRTGAGGNGD